MFHETRLAPFRQIRKLRSPDVARFPFVGGSTHAVMTPLWMPGFSLLSAEASEATATNTNAAVAATNHFLPFDFAILNLPSAWRAERTPLPGVDVKFQRSCVH
jgi:hypothetical protein